MDREKIAKEMYNAVDLIKLIACILIVGAHCLPLSVNEGVNYYYGQWFFRFCVPLFFISTGFFFSHMQTEKKKEYIKRIILIYVISAIIYLPLLLDDPTNPTGYNLIFGYLHLWYLSALAFGLILLFVIERLLGKWKYLFVLTLAGGVLFDEYYKLFDSHVLNTIVKCAGYIGGARHALFFAVPLLLIGIYIGEHRKESQTQRKNQLLLFVLFLLLLALGLIESSVLRCRIGSDISLDVSVFGWMPAIPLFLFGLSAKINLSIEKSYKARKYADVVYISHIWIKVLIDNNLWIGYIPRFITVLTLSGFIAVLIVPILGKLQKIHMINGGKNKEKPQFIKSHTKADPRSD